MSKQDKKRVDLDTRPNPNPLFTNYDYGGPEDGGGTGPGTGLYHNMGKYKSVKDFLEQARQRRKKRKEAMMALIEKINKV